jgi:hypothetical protein
MMHDPSAITETKVTSDEVFSVLFLLGEVRKQLNGKALTALETAVVLGDLELTKDWVKARRIA